MKITSFAPTIVTSKPDEVVKLFEDLGFEIQHHNEEVSDRPSYRMKDASGFNVGIARNDAAQSDQVIIRMNVDNLEEAHDLLTSHGFRDGPRTNDGKTSGSTGMFSPSGFAIGLVEHKRDRG